MNDVPRVAGTYVGFYKHHCFVEIDCPHCGHSHVILLPDVLVEDTDWTALCMPCTNEWLILCGVVPAEFSVTDE